MGGHKGRPYEFEGFEGIRFDKTADIKTRRNAMDRISFPYRSSSHLVLLHVIAESGSWQKYGLDVDYDHHISSGDAHKMIPTGEGEFVRGNPASTYPHPARRHSSGD